LDLDRQLAARHMLALQLVAALATLPYGIHKVEVRARSADASGEPRVEVRSAGDAGMGTFAAEFIEAGTWVCMYSGTLTTHEATEQRYLGEPPDYVFSLEADSSECIDAQNSTHFSRFFNHHENGTLLTHVSNEGKTVQFVASRDIHPGEELTFDYGMSYWLWRSGPTPESDSRSPGISELMTPLGFQRLLALPEDECRKGLQQFLYSAGSEFSIETLRHASVSELQAAAARYYARHALDPADPTGASSSAFLAWVAGSDEELQQIRQFRTGVAPFPTTERGVVALAVYLLHRAPERHHVGDPLHIDECGEHIALLRDKDNDSACAEVLTALSKHAPAEHIHHLAALLRSWMAI